MPTSQERPGESGMKAAWSALLLISMALLHAPQAVGQAAGTLSPLDPALDDLARLEAFGLVPRGWTGQQPISVGRAAWLVRDARAWFAASELAERAREDVEATLTRLEGRLGPGAATRASALVEVEVGGGDSPGRSTRDADNGLGQIDAVVNPLWAYRSGRAYGDRRTMATGARATIPVGSRLAFGFAGRASASKWSAEAPGRTGRTVEAAYARGVAGKVSLQVGRDALGSHRGGRTGLLLSQNAPPVDLVRLGTERPLPLHLLGDTEFSLTAADLGASQNFPHAKLFVAMLLAFPAPGLELGLEILNKQGGKGAPEAPLRDRLKDLSLVWDLFRRDSDYLFSDKSVAVGVRWAGSAAPAPEIYGQMAFTDFDHERLLDAFTVDAAYLAGVRMRRLGASERHGLAVEAQRTGALMFKHHGFTSGMAVDGFLQGTTLGPDGRGVSATYAYDAPARALRTTLTVSVEDRSVDPHEAVSTPRKDVRRTGDLPNEVRQGLHGAATRFLGGGAGGVEACIGVERVRNFGYTQGRSRSNAAALLRLWWAF